MSKKQKIVLAVRFLGVVDIGFGLANISSLFFNAEAITLGVLIRVLVLSFTYLFIGFGLIKLWPLVRPLKIFVHGFLLLILWVGITVSQFAIFGLAEGFEIMKGQLSSTYGLFGIFLLFYAIFIIIFFTRPSVKEIFSRPSLADKFYGAGRKYAKNKTFKGDEVEYALEQEAKEVARKGLD
ncbi:MAG TPA: hypothetical protein VGA53_03525 [Candidatus Paceibacterota bacterium]